MLTCSFLFVDKRILADACSYIFQYVCLVVISSLGLSENTRMVALPRRWKTLELFWHKSPIYTVSGKRCHSIFASLTLPNSNWFSKFFQRHAWQYVSGKAIITGRIARSANLPVFSLLRGRFWGFSPRRGDTLQWWGWNLARRRVPNFTPIGATTRV